MPHAATRVHHRGVSTNTAAHYADRPTGGHFPNFRHGNIPLGDVKGLPKASAQGRDPIRLSASYSLCCIWRRALVWSGP